MRLKKLDGTTVFTATITPFHVDGRIDFESFEKLLRRQADAGNGLVVLGSTGENLSMTEEEKREVVEFTAGLKLSTPVVVGIGGFNLPAQLDWIKWLEEQAVDGYMFVVPLYAKPMARGQEEWFRALLNAATRPCIIYNVPSRTGTSLALEAVTALRDHPNFWAIKEASGSIDQFHAYQQAAPNVKMYSGEDGLTPFLAGMGLAGVVSVSSNIWPAEVQTMLRIILEGRAPEILPLAKEAGDSVFLATNPIPAKVALHHLGVIASPTLRPPLNPDDFTKLDELMDMHKRVEQWMADQRRKAAAA